MTICGIIGWLPATGRPELRVYHSRISQCMAAPVQGAFKAAYKIIKYLALNKDLCLHQLWGADSDAFEWHFYSDSDQSSNAEVKNKRRSQLSYIAVRGHAPVMFGSKASSVHFGTDLDGFSVSHYGLDKPTCHPDMSNIHTDVSSAAAEVYAASIALNELLHLGYVTDEMGLPPSRSRSSLRSTTPHPWPSARDRPTARSCATLMPTKHGSRPCMTTPS